MLTPHYADDDVTLYAGDCIEVMRGLPDNSVDAVVTDPPYDLTANKKAGGGFMGKSWDATGIAFEPATWAEALRVLKPGGHLVAFGGTRTWHRLACAIEDAGFEIRDSLMWVFASGFPKSLDVSKAIDKQRYAREDVYRVTAWIRAARDAAGISNRDIDAAFGFAGMAGHWTSAKSQPAVPTLEQVPQLLDVLGFTLDKVPDDIRDLLWTLNGRKGQPGPNWAKREVVGATRKGAQQQSTGRYGAWGDGITPTAPATAAAQQWQGWGTALKPAYEPIVLARKPLAGTVAATVLEHGTGALNIDGCRVPSDDGFEKAWDKPVSVHAGNFVVGNLGGTTGRKLVDLSANKPVGGRWPANVILDETAAAMLDAQSGWSSSGQPSPTAEYGKGEYAANNTVYGAGLATTTPNRPPLGDSGGASRFFYTAKAGRDERPNVDGIAHPTVKPLDLMRWLVRLVTPPGGVVLEPFAGSGTTAEACVVEGMRCIAIEREADYLPLIVQRLTKPIERTLL